MTKVAVLLSSYNGEEFIREQIDSILNQQFDGDLKLVVRDDGSYDNTISILESYVNDGKITLVKGNNVGSTSSFFELLKYAKNNLKDCDYFTLSDQDDVWDKNKIASALEMLQRENNGKPLLYGCRSRLTDKNLCPIGFTKDMNRPLTFMNVAIQNIIAGHNQVFDKGFLELIPDDIDCSRIYCHDFFIIQLAAIFGKIIFDKRAFTFYRQHENNVLGLQKNYWQWIKERWNRFNRGDGEKIARQLAYICDLYGDKVSNEDKREIDRFLSCRNDVGKRFLYIFTTKLYRQTFIEDCLFRFVYLVGMYG